MASRGLGTLTLDLVAKIGGFVEGMTKAERATDKSAKAMEKRAAELQKRFKEAGAAIGLALVGGLTAAAVTIKSTINSMDEMSKAAQKVGLSTEQFSRLAYAGSLADVSIESLQGALGKLTKSQAAALKSTSEQAKVFDALGIASKNADGSLRDSSDVLADFADRFQQMKGSPEAMAAGFALFGKSFQDIIPLLKDGGQGIRDAEAESDKLGKTLSTSAGAAAEQFNDNLTRLQTSVGGLWQGIASDLLPDLVRLTDGMVDFAKDGDNARAISDFIRTAFEGLAATASFLSERLGGIGKIIEGLTVNFYGLKEAAAGALSFDADRLKASLGLFGEARSLIFGGAAQTVAGSGAKPKGGPDFSNVIGGSSIDEASRIREEAARIKQAREYQRKLQAALGDPAAKPKKTGGGKSGGQSDAQREAEQLQRANDSLNESLTRQIALFGQTGEAARVRYEIEHGELQKLSQPEKDARLAQAQKLDQMAAEKELQDKLTRSALDDADARDRQAKQIKDFLADQQFELALLGMTNDERERAIALRNANADAASNEGKQIIANVDAIGEASKRASQMDEFRRNVSDTFYDLATGAKSAKDALKDFFDSWAQQITRAIADNWAKKLFGDQGQDGGGQYGNIISSIFGLFGGGKAAGGPVSAGMLYRVNENRPEMLSVGGSDYLMMGAKGGRIDPNPRLAGGAGQTFNFNFAAPTEMRTQEQIAARVGFESQRAMARNR